MHAPVLPAETTASARPSATARSATSSEASLLRAHRLVRVLVHADGVASVQDGDALGVVGPCSRMAWMRASSPTSRQSMSVPSETSATPRTISSGRMVATHGVHRDDGHAALRRLARQPRAQLRAR